jgi:hypothetical protein
MKSLSSAPTTLISTPLTASILFFVILKFVTLAGRLLRLVANCLPDGILNNVVPIDLLFNDLDNGFDLAIRKISIQ